MCQRYKIEYCLSVDEKISRGLTANAGVKNLSTEDEIALRSQIQMEFFALGKQLLNQDLVKLVEDYVNSIDNHPMQNYSWSKHWCRRFLLRHNIKSRLTFDLPSVPRELPWELELNEYGKLQVARFDLKFDGSTPPLHFNLLQCQKMLEKEKIRKLSNAVKTAEVLAKRSIAARGQQVLVTRREQQNNSSFNKDFSECNAIPAKRKTSPLDPLQFNAIDIVEEPMTSLFKVVSGELCRLDDKDN